MNEFALEEGEVSKGIIGGVLGVIKYLVIPLAIMYVVTSFISGVGEDIPVQDKLDLVMNAVILVGIPITVLSFFTGFYPKGSYSRMTFGLITVLAIGVWIWMVTLGGNLTIEVEGVGVALSFTPLVYLFLLPVGLKGVYYLAEAPSYREEWLEERGKEGPEELEEEKEQEQEKEEKEDTGDGSPEEVNEDAPEDLGSDEERGQDLEESEGQKRL